MPIVTGQKLASRGGASSYVSRELWFPPGGDTVISSFQSGHGWTASGTGSQTDDTSTYTFGTRALRITPSSDTTEQVSTKTLGSPLDLSDSYLRMVFLLGGVLSTFKVRVASGNIATDYAEATVWSSSMRTWLATGQWEHSWLHREDFTVTGAVNWSGITTIQLRAAVTGSGGVNCVVNRLSVTREAESGCVVLAFDDGLSAVWAYAKPRMSLYDFPGTAFIIADMVDTGTNVDTRGTLTTAQLQELQYRFGWEISSHAYSLANHNAGQGFTSVSVADTERDFYRMREWLDRRNLMGGGSFAWPLGAYGSDQTYMDIARKFFDSSRSTKGNAGSRTHERFVHPVDRHKVRAWSLNGLTDTTSDVSAALTQVANRREILILVFHQLTTGSVSAGTDWTVTNFNAVVDAVAASGLPVRTYGQALAGY